MLWLMFGYDLIVIDVEIAEIVMVVDELKVKIMPTLVICCI